MKKTNIEWADYTWNPVTGCQNTCAYCYARQLSKRFSGDVRLNLSDPRFAQYREKGLYVLDEPFVAESGGLLTFPFGFAPTLHTHRLDWPAQIKNTANIFVGSMADLFGDWVPDAWLQLVFAACEKYPHHNYLFLTKNPARYLALAREGRLPKGDNYWYGTTTTTEDTPYFYAEGYNTFCSIEPLHGDFEANGDIRCNWIVIGAESGKGKIIPQPQWVQNIVEAAKAKNVPVFMKDSLADIVKTMCYEFPPRLCNKPVSKKLAERLFDNCCHCGKRQARKSMTAILYREARGQGVKKLGYCCKACFESVKNQFSEGGR